MKNLRPCTYKGEKCYFHMFFQEGNPQYGDSVGAVMERQSGDVFKVWDITEIKFEQEAANGNTQRL
jgi:hypothetical protein